MCGAIKFMNLEYYWSKLLLRIRGKSIRGSSIAKSSRINSGSNIVNSQIGKYSYCGYDCWIIDAEIGSFCSISNNVRIGGPAHPIDWVSTSPVFHNGNNMLRMNFSKHSFDPYKRTIIGNDVWIGECVLIKSGVKIGNGSVIGMGSVVTKDIGDYEIWAGNPARFIRNRFDKDISDRINKSQWWNESDEKMYEYSSRFNSPIDYLKENGL